MSRGRVLVVDDESTILIALKLAFEDAELEAVTALSAEDAIARLREEPFDAMLFDKNLPGKDGVELVRLVRSENADVPIVMMTAFGSAESALDTLNLGIDRYVEKPFPKLKDVIRMIAELVAAGRRRWLPDPGLFVGVGRPARAEAVEPPIQALVVSADPEMRAGMGDPIAIRNARIWQAATGEEAGALAEQHAPELIVVHATGEQWGLPLLRVLRASAPEALFAVLAAGDPPLEVLKELIELGVGGLLEPALNERYTRRISELVQRVRLR